MLVFLPLDQGPTPSPLKKNSKNFTWYMEGPIVGSYELPARPAPPHAQTSHRPYSPPAMSHFPKWQGYAGRNTANCARNIQIRFRFPSAWSALGVLCHTAVSSLPSNQSHSVTILTFVYLHSRSRFGLSTSSPPRSGYPLWTGEHRRGADGSCDDRRKM